MNVKEKFALAAMGAGFSSLVGGVAAFSPAAAAVIGGLLLIAFGIALDRHAV
ncbi:hypothetical protein [Alcaligenes sp. HNGD-HTN06]|uniref:hypothetical protein n=1 Tax=Alcaligenes sp. HNGD-HTN06 TaxID=3416924 RepID=UPI003CE7B1BC